MKLFRLNKTNLNEVEQIPFKLERDIQNLVEVNTESVFNLKFIKSELTVGKYRIDTLCFDEENNSFVIVEYKKGNSYSVIDQGYTYLQLLLNNKSDFLLVLSQHFNKVLRMEDVDWSQSRIIFVSPSYNSAGNVSGYLDLPSSPAYNPTISIGAMNPQGAGSQTSLLGSVSHTLSSTFDDGFNDHATNFGDAITKTVHSVDSYDSNASPLCLTSDSPILKSDGTIVEIGDLEEGDILSGYSLNGLSEDESAYLDWSTDSLSTSATTTQVVSIIYSLIFLILRSEDSTDNIKINIKRLRNFLSIIIFGYYIINSLLKGI